MPARVEGRCRSQAPKLFTRQYVEATDMIAPMTILRSFLRMLRPRATFAPRDRDIILNYDEDAPVEYETRVVAFCDILGWRQAVDASVSDPQMRRKLLNAVW